MPQNIATMANANYRRNTSLPGDGTTHVAMIVLVERDATRVDIWCPPDAGSLGMTLCGNRGPVHYERFD